MIDVKIKIPKAYLTNKRKTLYHNFSNAIRDLKLMKKVKLVWIKVRRSLKKDIEIDYSKLDKGIIVVTTGRQSALLDENNVYHEIGHVYDAVFNSLDFSATHPKDFLLRGITGIILNMSLDGRLAKMGLPHIYRNERRKSILIFYDIAAKRRYKLIDREKFLHILMKFWGKDFKSPSELLQESGCLIKKLKAE